MNGFRTGLFLLLTVSPVFPGFAQEQDIRAEKPLVIIPEPPNHWLWLLLLIIPALAIAGWLIWRWWKNKQSPETRYADIALNRLNKIRPLISEDSPEPLVNEVSDILRNYIENRFEVKALSQSSEEFLQNLQENPTYSNIQSYQSDIDQFLLACDKVKFGRAEMERDHRESLVSVARNFVQNSRPVD